MSYATAIAGITDNLRHVSVHDGAFQVRHGAFLCLEIMTDKIGDR